MHKYRGERGIRNYRREAKELGLIVAVMAVVCAIMVALAIASFFYVRAFENNAIPVVLPVMAMEELSVPESGGILSHSEVRGLAYLPPLIPMYWGAGIFFDPATNKIILTYGVAVTEIRHNYFKYIYEITLEGVNLPVRRFPVLPPEIMPVLITQQEDSITIRTRKGVFVRYGQADNYIQIVDPRETYHTIVIIDPGHGGIDTGAPSALGRHAPNESEVNLAITLKLLEIFNEPGILLIPTRTTDIFINNSYRYRFANALGDYFISIHCNADAVSRLSQGTLTLYGQALGSHELAYSLQNALISALGSRDRGIHYAPGFRILGGSQIPVALLELLFISNPQEAARLADPAVQMLVAETLAEAIAALPPVR